LVYKTNQQTRNKYKSIEEPPQRDGNLEGKRETRMFTIKERTSLAQGKKKKK